MRLSGAVPDHSMQVIFTPSLPLLKLKFVIDVILRGYGTYTIKSTGSYKY